MNRTTAIRWFDKIVELLLSKGLFDESLGYDYRMYRIEMQFTSAYLTYKGEYVTVFDDVRLVRLKKDVYILEFYWVKNKVHEIHDIRKM